MEKTIEQLKAENQMLRSALRFYGAPKNWIKLIWASDGKGGFEQRYVQTAEVFEDKGLRARKTLELLDDDLEQACDQISNFPMDPKVVFGWLANDLQGVLKKYKLTFDNCGLSAESIVELINLAEREKKITRAAARDIIFPKMIETKKSALEIAKTENLMMLSDPGDVSKVVCDVIDKFPEIVADYLAGKEQALNALLGKCMAELNGRGDPAMIRSALENKLNEIRKKINGTN